MKGRPPLSELITATEALRLQVQEAQTTIEALTLENQALSKRLGGFSARNGAHDDTFVTTTAATAICDHCGTEVPKANYQMHYARCIRVNKRCEMCGEVLSLQDLTKHVEDLKSDTVALLQAAEKGDVEMLDRLLAHGMDVKVQAGDPAHSSALHACAKGPSLPTAHFLLSRGADINQRNAFGETPLHVAVSSKTHNTAMISYLLSRGADPLATNSLGDSPYALAMRQGDYTVSLLFTKSQASPLDRGWARPRSASSFRPKPRN